MCGFGGGSSYIAILVISTIPYLYIPPIALICNIIVVTSGLILYLKSGYVKFNMLLPFIISSIPAAYFCGRISIHKNQMLLLLALALLFSGIRMLLNKREDFRSIDNISTKKLWLGGISLGAFIGGLAGLVGIGGGIFLSPILNLLRWGNPKQIAGTCTAFILVNSISGLIGQSHKIDSLTSISDYSLLFIVVFLGGQIGSRLGSRKFSLVAVKTTTAILVIVASVRIFIKVTGNA